MGGQRKKTKATKKTKNRRGPRSTKSVRSNSSVSSSSIPGDVHKYIFSTWEGALIVKRSTDTVEQERVCARAGSRVQHINKHGFRTTAVEYTPSTAYVGYLSGPLAGGSRDDGACSPPVLSMTSKHDKFAGPLVCHPALRLFDAKSKNEFATDCIAHFEEEMGGSVAHSRAHFFRRCFLAERDHGLFSETSPLYKDLARARYVQTEASRPRHGPPMKLETLRDPESFIGGTLKLESVFWGRVVCEMNAILNFMSNRALELYTNEMGFFHHRTETNMPVISVVATDDPNDTNRVFGDFASAHCKEVIYFLVHLSAVFQAVAHSIPCLSRPGFMTHHFLEDTYRALHHVRDMRDKMLKETQLTVFKTTREFVHSSDRLSPGARKKLARNKWSSKGYYAFKKRLLDVADVWKILYSLVMDFLNVYEDAVHISEDVRGLCMQAGAHGFTLLGAEDVRRVERACKDPTVSRSEHAHTLFKDLLRNYINLGKRGRYGVFILTSWQTLSEFIPLYAEQTGKPNYLFVPPVSTCKSLRKNPLSKALNSALDPGQEIGNLGYIVNVPNINMALSTWKLAFPTLKASPLDQLMYRETVEREKKGVGVPVEPNIDNWGKADQQVMASVRAGCSGPAYFHTDAETGQRQEYLRSFISEINFYGNVMMNVTRFRVANIYSWMKRTDWLNGRFWHKKQYMKMMQQAQTAKQQKRKKQDHHRAARIIETLLVSQWKKCTAGAFGRWRALCLRTRAARRTLACFFRDRVAAKAKRRKAATAIKHAWRAAAARQKLRRRQADARRAALQQDRAVHHWRVGAAKKVQHWVRGAQHARAWKKFRGAAVALQGFWRTRSPALRLWRYEEFRRFKTADLANRLVFFLSEANMRRDVYLQNCICRATGRIPCAVFLDPGAFPSLYPIFAQEADPEALLIHAANTVPWIRADRRGVGREDWVEAAAALFRPRS